MVISRNVRNPKIVGNPMIGMDRETLSREETDFHGFRDFWKCRDYRVCWNFRVYWNYRIEIIEILENFGNFENPEIPTQQNSILKHRSNLRGFQNSRNFGNLDAYREFRLFQEIQYYKNKVCGSPSRSRNKFPSCPKNFGISNTSNNQ